MLCLQLVAICVFLQIPGCFPSCLIVGSVANCAFQNLVSVPALPPHITHLFLEMNRIGEINSTSLSGLERLQELDLGKQGVQLVIRNDAFSRQSRLKKLRIDSNADLRLEPGAFVGLSSLQKLHLGYCSLNESILKGKVLQPLSSLETLDLFGNRIQRLQPAAFFANMSHLKEVNLKLNTIDRMCESDLGGFQGKHFKVLNLDSVRLKAMLTGGFDWQGCGNPFRGMSFQTLDLSHNGFSVNMSKQFFRAIEGTKISHLKLSGHMGKGFSFNNLPDPDRSTFAGLRNSSVLTVDLSKNWIFALQRGVFSPLRDVVNIDLSQNRVNRIDRNAFEGLQGHLASLNLSHNLLGELYSYTFASLTNLRVLDLSYNHIGALGYTAFRGLPKLVVLDLTGNALRDLGFPAALPRLVRLLLSDNLLTHSSMRSVASFASNVVHLDIKNNRITDLANVYTFLTRLKRLQHLSYGGNSIRWCVPSAQVGPNELQFLDLHRSSLQSVWAQGNCLNLFDKLGKVLVLYLNSNALQALPQGIFKGLTSVVQMDLSSNSLTYLHPDVLPRSLAVLDLSNNFIASPDPDAFRSLSFLDLKTNRFHCDADLRGFLTWLNQTNVTFVSPVRELRCEFPSRLYKVPLLNYTAQVTQQEKRWEVRKWNVSKEVVQ
ncbi:toll-like receptor 5 [Hippoglossus stenolepis]|uniref:toll-like receptor 5 n=1 Tax=Hippoglossus stenolepis TaxID=195615 RepID=UPI00159C17B1|nr:toll-like receptor 5 [Hippoglossus stenolepis]